MRIKSLNLKQMLKILLIIGFSFSLLNLGGCAKKGGRYGSGSSSMDEGGVGDTVRFYGTSVSPEQERELLAQRTYYFGYDRYDVSEEDMMSIYAHARRICQHSSTRVRVEGHTDERGSREYNIALGEKRANAVANILILKGVSRHQISVVSYGKEKPEIHGNDESGWSKNRRAVIVYEVE